MERSTRQRTAIQSVLESAGRPLSPQEILEAAQADVPALGMATVYRQLKAMQEEELLVVVDLPGENARYELAGLHHHHHFQCHDCGRAFDIPGCPGNLAKLAPAGFSVDSHELTLYGQCADCGKKPAGRRKAAVKATVRKAAAHRH
jgi:Fur family ferric uptake transcriptional regulator